MRRVIGVSTCPQVGSTFNEGIWNAQTKIWEGSAIRRTMEADEAHYMAFLLGKPSLKARPVCKHTAYFGFFAYFNTFTRAHS